MKLPPIKQEDVVPMLMRHVRNHFFADHLDRYWPQERAIEISFLGMARWFDGRALDISPKSFLEIALKILDGMRYKGNWRGEGLFSIYLSKCINNHFAHEGDAIYSQCKKVRDYSDGVPAADIAEKLLNKTSEQTVQASCIPFLVQGYRSMSQARKEAAIAKKKTKRKVTLKKEPTLL